MAKGCYKPRLARWHDTKDQEQLRVIRQTVFVDEQQVPIALEWTGDDGDCTHVLVFFEGTAVATGRLDPDGHIGRMAVLEPHRGQGAGSAVLHMLLDTARKRGDPEVHLNAQLHALDFYRRAGFEAYGPEFDDAGIPHRSMMKTLK